MSDSLSLITEMRSEPSDARSDGSEVHSMVLCTSLHNTNPKSGWSSWNYIGSINMLC
ncbi:hypothetical protein RHMOL_Rhmol08G0149700 [Rhododendron molle]|nr:hypothetical protein RHMOL_Rhmol08G0149700 [Rhododendron molle]